MKKIAIYHNLKNGGGYEQLKKILYFLSKKGFVIDIYTHQKNKYKYANKNICIPIKKTKNSFEQIIQVLFELRIKQKQISKKIIDANYDYIFVFPCYITQSPYIIRYLPKNKTFYFFLEPKREFYEKTSFDYFSLKRKLSRLIRYPIKLIDKTNCKSAKNIISNSFFSKFNLKKIYGKNSNVVYPGIKYIKQKKIKIINNHKFLSFGLLSMLKGHHISAELVKKIFIYGEKSNENLIEYLPKNTFIKMNIPQKNKYKIYKKYSFFMANQINEPFGLTTVEAAINNCYIFGKNEGGTSEIIKNGLNGIFLSNEIYKNILLIKIINKKKKIMFYKTCIIDWNNTVEKILKVIKYE